ncbi:hypothetical protein B0H10DRAFT_2046293 [Mycena sp. CBHHK59/15]|nr:hypothetical protein B0H10DRAFT_2046293 [Mycena sp. CBHHK59/15]
MHILLPFFSDVDALVISFIFLTQLTFSTATLWNRTIDDTQGDSVSGLLPAYDPLVQFYPNESGCSFCGTHPDPAGAFGGTWHDGSQLPGTPSISVTLSFNGTAIYVFCILANNLTNVMTNSYFTFTLDGVPQGNFIHNPLSTPDYQYMVNVYRIDGLKQKSHVLVMATDNESTGSLILFDYAIYTFDDGLTSQIPSTSATATPVTETITLQSSTSSNTDPLQSSSTLPLGPSKSPSPPEISVSSYNPVNRTSSASFVSSSLGISASPTTARALSASKRSRFVGILGGALASAILVVLVIGTIIYRRWRARKLKEWEDTRVHLPVARGEWVQLTNIEAKGSRKPTVSGNGPSGRDAVGILDSETASIRNQAASSRPPSLRTVELLDTTPPGYDASFQRHRLLQANIPSTSRHSS